MLLWCLPASSWAAVYWQGSELSWFHMAAPSDNSTGTPVLRSRSTVKYTTRQWVSSSCPIPPVAASSRCAGTSVTFRRRASWRMPLVAIRPPPKKLLKNSRFGSIVVHAAFITCRVQEYSAFITCRYFGRIFTVPISPVPISSGLLVLRSGEWYTLPRLERWNFAETNSWRPSRGESLWPPVVHCCTYACGEMKPSAFAHVRPHPWIMAPILSTLRLFARSGDGAGCMACDRARRPACPRVGTSEGA